MSQEELKQVVYKLRFKDDFAIKDTALVLLDCFAMLRLEYNQIKNLERSKRPAHWTYTNATMESACNSILAALQDQLKVLVNRALRHKDWRFKEPSDAYNNNRVKLYTGMLFSVSVGKPDSHIRFLVDTKGSERPEHYTTISLEW